MWTWSVMCRCELEIILALADAVHTRRQKLAELAQSCTRCENPIWSIQCYRLSRITLALAYMLYHLSATWLQLQKIEQSLKRVGADSGMSLKNTGDRVQL